MVSTADFFREGGVIGYNNYFDLLMMELGDLK